MPSLVTVYFILLCLYLHRGGLGRVKRHTILSSFLVPVEVVDPGIPLGALLLARGKLSDVSLVLETASVLLAAASSRSVGEVAVEDGRGVNLKCELSH